jgi:hypothetical protein
MLHRRASVHRGTTGTGRRRPLGPRWYAYAGLAYFAAWCVAAAIIARVRPTLFVEAPAILLLVISVSVALAFAWGGQLLVHQIFAEHDFVQHNDVGGYIITVAGTLYAVVLGFLTVVAWQHFTDARQHVALEAAAATDAWHAAVGIPIANRTRVREDMLKYAHLMLNDEWPTMREGRFDEKGDFIVMDAISAAGTFKPANLMESNSQSATLTQLGALHDGRLSRISDNSTGVTGFEWLVLLAGAVCVIGFCWLFGVSHGAVHLIMTGTVAVIIAVMLVLLFELQYPFRSDLRIGTESWEAVIHHITLMQEGAQMNMRM